MVDHKAVSPLTIIAIFAGIIEASALAALPFLGEKSQTLYTWFLVGFPFFLTALFFLTLNFNAKSFYSPGPEAPLAAEPVMAAAEPVTVLLSGPSAGELLEQHVLQAIAQPVGAERRWCFCNVDRAQRVELSIGKISA
ncbi:hypothetical protein F3J44_05290 [Pantoea sp. Tr-811]|uniref:hypothetical protein n=1 Tax=Pantoea sp. Tr-811 TaxID=2608361 RepID=UPI001423531F|nr:hypothetical protein [Pantoea sp. Tr-811]NIF25794.1 hypothetical protein [Pantoea sp. Tr-811]